MRKDYCSNGLITEIITGILWEIYRDLVCIDFGCDNAGVQREELNYQSMLLVLGSIYG
jgi:hypothetical protein